MKFLELEGKTNDLLSLNREGTMKMTRLLDINADTDTEEDEIIDVAITTTNPHKNFPKFNQLLGKQIRITVEILD